MQLPEWGIIVSTLTLLNIVLVIVAIPWILAIKREPSTAVAWSLVVITIPYIGFILFFLFGYNFVHRPLRRLVKHRQRFRDEYRTHRTQPLSMDVHPAVERERQLAWLATKVGATPLTKNNQTQIYFDTNQAYQAILNAVRQAQHHIHVEFYIIQSDEIGNEFFQLLVEKAQQNVEVRILYDAFGSSGLNRKLLKQIAQVGGKTRPFLSINLLRRRVQINLRNHRKILVVDGQVAFTGGMNIGREYLGYDEHYGNWQDVMIRIEGPAVSGFQRIFIEDWNFATDVKLKGKDYYPKNPSAGSSALQVIESGPDQVLNPFREMVFAAISSAQHRIWIASPYFVPDSGILDALQLAVRLNVDVRILLPQRPDNWLTYFAGRYYWSDLLAEGVQFYEFTKGYFHSKLILIDHLWGTIGSANFDWRSFYLNFEITCVLHSRSDLDRIEQGFNEYFQDTILVNPSVFVHRPLSDRIMENACRLFSPIL